MQACVASILELPLSAVPFIDPDAETPYSFMGKWREFVRHYGYDLLFISKSAPGFETEFHPRGYSIGIGEAKNGEDHAVILLDCNAVHDPYLGGEPLKEIKGHIYFVAMNPKGLLK